MTKHTLFMVHGMGRHEGHQWSDELWDKLIECSKRYKHFKDHPLDGYAEPHPIGYDRLIQEALARWEEQATTFGDFSKANNLDLDDTLDWLTGIASDDADFRMTHIADVIICRFFPHEYGQIRANVQHDIFSEIHRKRSLDVDAKFSVMAHSLGTSVAHDALAELGAAPKIGSLTNTFGVKNFNFQSIHMHANVSRLLQTKPKAYESIIRPGPKSTKNRYCLRMYCADHELDPFAKPKPFDPVTWGNSFRLLKLNHYRGWNVHGWLHYLDNPRVHIPLLKSITKSSAIPSGQARDAVDDYPRYGGDLENLAVAQQKIAELHALAQGIDQDKEVKENLDSLNKMWLELNELKALAGDTWTTLERSLP